MGVELIGTGHVLEKSVEEVSAKIGSMRPDVVAVELDNKRFHALAQVGFNPEKLGGQASFKNVLGAFKRSGGSFPVLAQFFLGLIQKEFGKNLGVAPGADMCAAIVAASRFNVPVALIDRDIEVTMNHVLSVPLSEGVGLLRSRDEELMAISVLLQDNIENILEKDNLEKIMGALKTKQPKAYAALVDERDQYMAYKLHNIQKQNAGKNILAVVGAGHQKGIAEYLAKIETGFMPDLKEITRKKKISVFKSLFLVFLVFAAFILIKIQSMIQRKPI